MQMIITHKDSPFKNNVVAIEDNIDNKTPEQMKALIAHQENLGRDWYYKPGPDEMVTSIFKRST